MADKKRFKVVDGPIGVRSAPGGDKTGVKLGQGEEVEILADAVEKGGYVWLQHSKGWSAERNSDGDEVFMLDISSRDPNLPRIFRVVAQTISIRETAGGKKLPQKLVYGTEVRVEGSSRTEAAGYIWWKHDKGGWSSERSVDGDEVFMKEVFATAAKGAIDPAKKVQIPATWKGTKVFQVAQQGTKVRDKPSTDPRGMIINTMKRGKSVTLDLDNIVEADGFYWAKHESGWSAIMSVDGKTVFLGEPGTIPGLVYIGPDGPKAADLPGYRALITRLPVTIEDTDWFQYYGNNMWAFTNGKKYGYDKYSQALHGGLDFGNSARSGIRIYAGISGQFVKAEYPSPNNARIFIQSGDYQFIYQHITSIQSFAAGQAITPDTYLANIEHQSINNGWNHLHFEVRYMNEWIINPLLLMTEALYNQITSKFKPDKPNSNFTQTDSLSNFFYKSATWTKWTTPLDQPMIALAGQPIGPRYEKKEGV
ncbi:MAG: peptidoglycan DD-metalloendopeptidase family protein [Chloroflexi bacterium]|nr:peptidoglycan DD-metalloendopeptidase family protein [Chloroflexota bacterium]